MTAHRALRRRTPARICAISWPSALRIWGWPAKYSRVGGRRRRVDVGGVRVQGAQHEGIAPEVKPRGERAEARARGAERAARDRRHDKPAPSANALARGWGVGTARGGRAESIHPWFREPLGFYVVVDAETSFHLRLSRAPARTPRCAEMASPDSGARAIVANASGDAAEDGDALASKRRRLADADAEPSQADDSVSDGATRRAHRWRRQTPRDPAEGSMDGTTSPRASSSPFSSPSRGVPTAADWCVPPRRPRARTLGSSEARDRIEPTNSPEPLPPLSPDPVPRPTSPVRSPSFPSHAQLFNCGRVCKAWHGDAMHVLMRDTAVSGRGARRFTAGAVEEPRTFQAKRRRRHRDDAARETRRERRDGC